MPIKVINEQTGLDHQLLTLEDGTQLKLPLNWMWYPDRTVPGTEVTAIKWSGGYQVLTRTLQRPS